MSSALTVVPGTGTIAAMQRTPLYTLIEVKLGTDLESYVAQRRAGCSSWRQIAADITTATGVPVTHASLATWFPALNSESATTPAEVAP